MKKSSILAITNGMFALLAIGAVQDGEIGTGIALFIFFVIGGLLWYYQKQQENRAKAWRLCSRAYAIYKTKTVENRMTLAQFRKNPELWEKYLSDDECVELFWCGVLQ